MSNVFGEESDRPPQIGEKRLEELRSLYPECFHEGALSPRKESEDGMETNDSNSHDG